MAEHAKDRNKGVVVTIDEIQHLPKQHLRPLVVGLHEISQLDLPLLMVGAGLPSVPGLLGEARTYAERLFSFVDINSLDDDAARALAEPASVEGVSWDDGAIEEVLSFTQGYPYFLHGRISRLPQPGALRSMLHHQDASLGDACAFNHAPSPALRIILMTFDLSNITVMR